MKNYYLLNKLKLVEKTFNELTSRLSRSANLDEDLSELSKIAEAYCSLKQTIDTYQEWKLATAELVEAQELFAESAKELEMQKFVATEIKKLETKISQLEKKLEILLYLREEDSMKNVLLEIQALAGGEYSCFFVGELVKMYLSYAERQNWRVKIVDENRDWNDFGFNNVILEIKGDSVYGKLKWEAGIHEAEDIKYNIFWSKQKQPATAMVKVMPEPELNELQIKSEDIELKCYTRTRHICFPNRWQLVKEDC